MRRLAVGLLGLCLLPAGYRAGATETGEERSPEVFFNLRSHATAYAGPGRDRPPPADFDEVSIGYFGPGDARHPEYGDLWRGAVMAVDEENRRGGYRGKPFRLVPVWSENPWGSGVGGLARMAYDDKVWAFIGGVDGPSTHLAEQVVAKARLTLISPGSTDKTVNLANVPWMFSCMPGDQTLAPLLAEAVAGRVGNGRFVIASANDHDSRLLAGELGACLRRRSMVPAYHFTFEPNGGNAPRLAAQILETDAQAVVILAGALESASLSVALRSRDFAGRLFGGPCMGRRLFLEKSGASAEGVIFPLLYDGENGPGPFAGTFHARFGYSPDYTAAYGYDAVRLLVAAIRISGLNRAHICDAVRNAAPWQGVTGKIVWDGLGSNTMTVHLGRISAGRIVRLTGTRPPPLRPL